MARALRRSSTRGLRWIEVSLAPSVGLLRPLLVALRRSLAIGDDGASSGIDVDSATIGPAVSALRTLLRDERRPDTENRDEAAFAIESLLVALAARRPLVLAVEGVHGAERGGDIDAAPGRPDRPASRSTRPRGIRGFARGFPPVSRPPPPAPSW